MRRWAAALVALLAVTIGGGLFVVTRSWFIVRLVQPQLEERLGGPVRIGRATYRGEGGFVFEGIELEAPGLRSPARRLVYLEHMVAVVDADALWRGEIVLRDVEMSGLHIRLSEDARQSGFMNFMSLRPQWKTDVDILPPTLRIHDVTVQMGAHDGERFDSVGQRMFTGAMHPVDDAPGWFRFELAEIDSAETAQPVGGVVVEGQWHAATHAFETTLHGLELNPGTYDMCPSLVRFWWEKLGLEGRVGRSDVVYVPGERMGVRMNLEGVSLDLPTASDPLWAKYEDGASSPAVTAPRLLVDQGEVELTPQRLTLRDLRGTLGRRVGEAGSPGMPYRGSFSVEALPPFAWSDRQAWFESVRNSAPFEMEFEISNFAVEPDAAGRTPPVALPAAVASLFDKFNLTRWSLDSRFTIRRAAPSGPAGAAPADAAGLAGIQVEGEVNLTQARGAFDAFPYPLDNVTARVTFNEREAVIEHLAATGANDSTVSVTGRIAPLGRDPGVEVNLKARDLATGETLRGALSEKRRAVYDMFFHEPSRAALAERGLLEGLENFTYGGTIDVDLSFLRPVGPGQRVTVAGEARIGRLGIIHEFFPYPATIESGRVVIGDDAVELRGVGPDDGLMVRSPTGGRGTVTGRVELRRENGEVRAAPQLHLAVEDDAYSPLLYAAIPMAGRAERAAEQGARAQADDMTADVSRLLAGLGLEGRVDYQGDIRTREDGGLEYEFEVSLGGSATPHRSLAEDMGRAGFVWPEGFHLDDISGIVRVSPAGIALDGLSGHDGDMDARAEGMLTLGGDEPKIDLSIGLAQMPLGPYLISLAPSDSEAKVRELWDRYEPSGRFGLDIEYEAAAGASDRFELVVRPGDLEVTLDGRRASVSGRSGDIRLADGQVTFRALNLGLGEGERDDGVIVLNGSYDRAESERDLRALGEWRRGRLESPLVPEVLRIVGATAQIEHYRTLAPSGLFDADFSYVSPRFGRPREFEIALAPSDIAARINDRELNAVFEPGLVVRFVPGRIDVSDLVGTIDGGTFYVDGQVNLADRVTASASVEYHGRLRSDDVEALLPRRIREWAESVKFTDDGHSSLRRGQILLREVDGPGGRGWEVNFAGLIRTADASISIGADLAGIDGDYNVTLSQLPGQWPDMDINAHVRSMYLNRRLITDLTAFAHFDRATESMLVPYFESDSHGGKISGNAKFGVGDAGRYEVRLDLAGVDLDAVVRPAPSAPTPDGAPVPAADGPGADGEVYATFHMVGRRGEPATRIGRGQVRTIGERVAAMPLVLRLVQIIQGVLPLGGDLDYLDAPFYIDGDRLIFEDIVMENSMGEYSPIQVFGAGSMNLTDFELDLRFQVRTWTPFMRQVLQPIGDQILGIQVLGPLNDPRVSLRPLPGLTGAGAPATIASGQSTGKAHDR